MSSFNEITRWSNLARLAGGRLPKLAIVAPFVAFIILHNEPLRPFLEMAESWHPNSFVETIAKSRFDLFYIGLVIVGIAVALFSLFSPSQVTSYDGYEGFIKSKENIKTDNGVAGSLRLTMEEYSRFTKRTDLAFDARERRFRFPRRFREGLWSLIRSLSRQVALAVDTDETKINSDPKGILSGLVSNGPKREVVFDALHDVFAQYSIDIFRLEYIRSDYESPVKRGVIFWLLILGIFVAVIPTLITTYLVIFDLFAVVEGLPRPNYQSGPM